MLDPTFETYWSVVVRISYLKLVWNVAQDENVSMSTFAVVENLRNVLFFGRTVHYASL